MGNLYWVSEFVHISSKYLDEIKKYINKNPTHLIKLDNIDKEYFELSCDCCDYEVQSNAGGWSSHFTNIIFDDIKIITRCIHRESAGDRDYHYYFRKNDKVIEFNIFIHGDSDIIDEKENPFLTTEQKNILVEENILCIVNDEYISNIHFPFSPK